MSSKQRVGRPEAAGRRPTKHERREQARRERLELQRRIARARRNRRIALALVALITAAGAVLAVTRPRPVSATPGELFRAAAEAKRTAGCGPVEDVGSYRPDGRDQSHASGPEELPPLSTYPSVPPASGPHNAIPLGSGVYGSPPPVDRVLHSLEHGAAVVWYSPDASGAELDRLREFFRGPRVGARVIVAPYDYPEQGAAGRLPSGTRMALVAWHRVQTCARVSLPAAFDFTATHAAPPFGRRPYLGGAPEAGAAF